MRIIAVDDEELARDALAASIKKAEPEAEIHSFSDPDEALSYLETSSCEVAFLDIEMPETNGVELAKKMKLLCPDINIIFSTGYDQYREAAFALHASGYLMKPVLPEDVRRELDDLRRPVRMTGKKRVQVQAFGNFKVFLDGMPMRFQYERTRELFAYLIDRTGAFCTVGELKGILFEDEPGHDIYIKKLRRDLLDAFDGAGCGEVIVRQRGRLAVDPSKIDCDYYDWREGKSYAVNLYRGEYMKQYSWAEFTHGWIEEPGGKI